MIPSLPPRASDDPLSALLDLPGVGPAVDGARITCEELRWHEGFRRRWREARTEADLRAVRGSAALEGARVPLVQVRRLATGAGVIGAGGAGGPEVGGAAVAGSPAPGAASSDADLRVVLGTLRATALAARWRPDLGAPNGAGLPPLGELLARLHTAAARDWLPRQELGRLRRGEEQPRDLIGLGRAPAGEEAAERIALLTRALAAGGAPAVVQVAVLHGELLAVRPFRAGNGVVARAAARLLMTVRGLDPTGTVVAEAGWAQAPNPYLSAAAGFATGTAEGVAGWLRFCAQGVVDGAAEGRAVADAVLAGRLGEPPVG